MDLTQTELIVLVVGAILVVIALIALIVRARAAQQRRERLAESFGPEYDRTVDATSRRRDAEQDLQARLDRHRDIDTRPIDPAVAEQFEQRLDDLQARFVDAPAAAVVAAESLLADIAVAAGYPDGPTEQLLGDISVDHPVAVAEHRRGQQVARRAGKDSPSTEQLRTALVSSRRLCGQLLAPSMAQRAGRDRSDVAHHEGSRSGAERRHDAPVADRRDHARSEADRDDPLGADAERHEEVRSGSDRRRDGEFTEGPAPQGDADESEWVEQPTAPPPPPPPPTQPPGGGADRVIELPEHEQVGPANRHGEPDHHTGEGRSGPDGRRLR